MGRIRELVQESGQTLDQIGRKMGYSDDVARKAVWQFMRTTDPRLSMLRRFAKAMGVPLDDLIKESKKDGPG